MGTGRATCHHYEFVTKKHLWILRRLLDLDLDYFQYTKLWQKYVKVLKHLTSLPVDEHYTVPGEIVHDYENNALVARS